MSTPEAMAAQQQQAAALKAAGPPYPPRVAAMGGVPNDTLDLGLSIMFVCIFVMLAATHMTIFIRNKKRNHVFIQSGVTFGFCMSRITTFSLRAAWSKHLNNVGLGIAATIFVGAGVILLYILNLVYARRIFRAYHPKHGHGKPAEIAFKAYFASIVLTLIMVIVCSVLLLYTLDPERIKICSRVQKFGIIYFAVACVLSIPIVLLSRYIPGSCGKVKFGKLGTLTHKCIVVLVASGLLSFSTIFRAVVTFLPPRPQNDPAWYHSKATFYLVIPVIEVLVVILYAASRVDQRFYVDNTKTNSKENSPSEVEAAKDRESF